MTKMTIPRGNEGVDDRFQWKYTTSGLWERDIDEVELFYSSVAKLTRDAGAGCFPVTACVNIQASVVDGVTNEEANDRIESAIRKAWITLRYEHPSLASWTDYDKETDKWTRFYSPLPSPDRDTVGEQQQRLASTLVTIESDMTGIEWLNDDPILFQRSTLFILRPSTTDIESNRHLKRTLLLRCPHEITDGIGILHLLQQLLAYAAKAYELEDAYMMPVFGNEARNLSPPLRTAASLPQTPTAEQLRYFDAIKNRNASLQTNMPLLGLPHSAEKGTAGKRQYLPLSLSNSLSAQVLSECKARGVSVTHAFSAALILALRDLQPRSDQAMPMRYFNQALINLRNACSPPFNTGAYAAAVYHMLSVEGISVDVVVPTSGAEQERETRMKEFATVTDQVRDFFASARGSESASLSDLIAVSPSVWASITPSSKSAAKETSSQAELEPNSPKQDDNAAPSFSSVSLSSIGNIDSVIAPKHGALLVSDAWVAAESIGPGVGLFLGTWEGKSTVVASFGSNWHDTRYMERFLGRILEQMVEGLGLDGEISES
ncbi:hypothetical protein BGZ61DRAFT_456152 [Ilyonectria robusta]|uniref:uncharacterized protein n=1 Tax=Ilyonectria robusta TaxID=1079257 RepID=UPI001E8E5359|nr:uncharacterized protein BGZ61DRAFT_456152 [Ilyonectria robusta]KAH8683641.1 hypothetical protein BGZ61DRAFT_456152 [Ilyonectria robusta]